MDPTVLNILLYNSEGPTLDFKKEVYKLGKNPKKNDVLKDLISFANHPSNQDKYIFVGVKEKNGMASEYYNIENPLDDANFQEFVKNSIEPELQFEYRNFNHDGKLLGYFKIFENNERPYLFKKDIKKPGTNQLEYKLGDGYIRIGTSTKKISRQDLEVIYENRFRNKDRKDDIVIKPIVGIPKEEQLYELGFRYLDINIENISNKSIKFELELEVFKSDDNLLITEKEVREIQRENHQNSYSIFGTSGPFIDVADPFFSSENKENSIILSDLRAAQYRLAQRDSILDVFNQNLLVRVKRMNPIKGKIIVRSDDFTDGMLEMDLNFEIPNIAQQGL